MDARPIPRLDVRIIVAIIVAAALALGAVAWAVTRNQSSSPHESPDATVGADCNGAAGHRIELNTQVVDPPPLLCFELTEARDVMITIATLDPMAGVNVTLTDATGNLLSVAQSEVGWDPQLGMTMEPDWYFIEVTGIVDGPVPAFLVSTATFPPTGIDSGNRPLNLPQFDQCGVSVPILQPGVDLAADGTAPWACLVLDAPTFVTVGATSPDPFTEPDLRMVIVDESLTELAGNDDAFGLDPQISTAMQPGTYLVVVVPWTGADTGSFDFYLDLDGTYLRDGAVSVFFLEEDSSVCTGAPRLSPGDTVTVTGTFWCLELEQAARVRIEISGNQSLVAEVMVDTPAGLRRLAISEDVDGSVIDARLQAGVLPVGVFTWFGGLDAGEYTITVSLPGEPN